jgi:16S rRNA (uracil1498-N3)-methyltransferase
LKKKKPANLPMLISTLPPKFVMSARRFFSSHPFTGNTLRLNGDEYHHLKNVNRAKPGDPVEVIDGQGSLFIGEIQSMKPDEALVSVKKIEKSPKSPVKVIVAPSLLKQHPMNVMIEKLTEIGVDEIRPVMFTRTDETYSPARLKKWNRIASQSLKVNKRLWLTDIYPPVSIEQILEISQPIQTKILLDIPGQNPGNAAWQFPVIAVIGPPGDITAAEREILLQNGFIPYKINDAVLKSETAAISIGAVLKYASGGQNPF